MRRKRAAYHVAVTLDGFIAHTNGSIAGFLEQCDHVADYLGAPAGYDTVVMGRKTYEFGYAYGLKPGERAYPNMEHWIFSRTMDVVPGHGVHIINENQPETIRELRQGEGPDIY